MKHKTKHDSNTSLGYELWLLFGLISDRRRRQLGLLLVLMVISSLSEVISLGAIIPFLESFNNTEVLLKNPHLQPLLSWFQIQTPIQLVTLLAVLFMVSVVVCNGIRILTITVQTHLAASIGSDISCQLYQKVIRQPYSFHIKQNSSDTLQLITSDTKSLSNVVLVPLLQIVTSGCTVLALAVGLFLINWSVALITTLILGGSYVGLYQWRRRSLASNSQIIVQNSQQQIKVVQESLGGIRDVLVGGTQDLFQSSYKQADIAHRRKTAANTVVSQTPRYVIESVAMLAIALLALMLGRNGDFSRVVPVLGGLALGANRLLPAIQRVFSSLVRIQSSRVSLQRVLQGLHRSLDPLQMLAAGEQLPLTQDLSFEDVRFRYSPEQDWVLNNLNLKIAAKTTVGFVGSTGSGKSTTADLILGLLKPQEGQICVDGRPLEGERLRQWQQSIAHVPQSIFLSDATIAENIAFGIPASDIDPVRIRHATRLAQIDEHICSLPAQYETYVGERGVRLSGGQRQRLGIARALYRRASVIVFDEATSALDTATEQEVMDAINSISHQFTVILIAHRLSTLSACDQIIEFHQGEVVASGSYQELMDRAGSFKHVLASATNSAKPAII